MQPLNVSFGIYAFLPMGWLFMAFIILGEAFLMGRYLVRKKFDKKIYLSATVSNLVSGALGIMLLLRKQYPFKITFRATLIANAFSYILGAVLIILLCI